MDDLVIVWVSRDLKKKLINQKNEGDFKTIRDVINANYEIAQKETSN